jgi:hypothetical protein
MSAFGAFVAGTGIGIMINLLIEASVVRKYRVLIRQIGDENIANMRRLAVLQQQLWVARRELAGLKGEAEPPHPMDLN